MAAPELTARVERVVEHAADTRSLFLRLADGARLAFRPGQFVSCLLPIGGETLTRPYSLASDPEDELLEICLNRVPGGPGSAYLLGLANGATVRLTGPWGTFTLDRARDAETVFIADGTGIAPIRPMIRRALATGARHALHLLHAADSEEHLLYRTEIADLARAHPILRVTYLESATLRAEILGRFVDADRDRSRDSFVCGVVGIVPTLRDVLRAAGYERRAVQYEKW